MADTNAEFQAAWTQLKPLAEGAPTLKAIAELFYMKGLVEGKTQALRQISREFAMAGNPIGQVSNDAARAL